VANLQKPPKKPWSRNQYLALIGGIIVPIILALFGFLSTHTWTFSSDLHKHSFPTNKAVLLKDALDGTSKGYGWEQYAATGEHQIRCWFQNGFYHASVKYIATNPWVNYCKAQNTNFSKFALEVNMVILQGDCGGIAIDGDRNNPNNTQVFYQFVVCQDGTYSFKKGYYETIPGSTGIATSFSKGLNVSNLIGIVVANTGAFDLYVNGNYLTTVKDTSDNIYKQGFIALGAVPINQSTEVAYSNAQAWSI
jgi:hypothetical protein